METTTRRNLFVTFLASVAALWLLGVGPVLAISIVVLIGCVSIVAEISEPDNALKRYIRSYSRVILAMAAAGLLAALVAMMMAVPIAKVAIELITGQALSGLSPDKVEQCRLMSLVIIIFSAFVAYMMVYGGESSGKWRKLSAGLLLIVFLGAFYQINIQGLPLGQRLAKTVSLALAKEVPQLATVNKDLEKVYLAECNLAEETFVSPPAPQERKIKAGSVVKVKLASPIVVYAEQGFINVLLPDDKGEFSLNPQKEGVWLPVEAVTLGQKKLEPAIATAAVKPVSPASVKPTKLLVGPVESLTPALEPLDLAESTGNSLIEVKVKTREWTTTGIIPQKNERWELGPVASREDILRLEGRLSGSMISNITPIPSGKGRWTAVLNFDTGWENTSGYQLEFRLKQGLPLVVGLRKI